MDALVGEMIGKLNLSNEQAQGAVTMVIEFLRTRLPPEMGAALSGLMSGQGGVDALSGMRGNPSGSTDTSGGIDDALKGAGSMLSGKS